ncbi:MAG TPA: amino acid synthesis family protein [Noviherbaspirillum sp.]|jgi:hypothetical protein|uniref:amino acid synthesis family protein n=1 Tax=Noviherbaspirillum sp. TaxID=1926288 RepID=UPI002F929A7C
MIEIRRIFNHVEDIFHEFGPAPAQPLRRGYIAAVLTNPYAGRYEPDILPMMEALNEVGVMLGRRLLERIGVPREGISSYGKGAIVGADGEIEHGALWHVPGGYAMRELLGWSEDAAAGRKGNALAIVPSTKKVAGPGATLDVPITHINASYVRSHFDAIEARVPGAPRCGEMVVILAMSTGARVHARVGGLQASEISKWDGLR